MQNPQSIEAPAKPSVLFLALLYPDFARFETTKYGLDRRYDLLQHKFAILSLIAWLRENGCEGHYVFVNSTDPEGIQKFEEAIARIKPDAIGMSLSTDEIMSHYQVIKLLKEKHPHLPIIIGGPHPSALPVHTLENFPLIDYVAVGDGEITLTEWLRKIAAGGGPPDMRDISGLAFRDGSSGIIVTEPRERHADINILPDPAFDLIAEPLRAGDSGDSPSANMVFPIFCSYGCRFWCTFCAADHGKYRYFKPGRVVDRIEWAQKEFGMRYFSILDGFWPPSREWLDEFCDQIESRGIRIQFQFSTRAETLTEEHFARLKKIGAEVIVVGIEAGDAAVLKRIKKGITLEKARLAFIALNKVGIFSIANFMVGNQGETRANIRSTLDFANELNPSQALFRAHCPLPGAEAFDLVPDADKNYWMAGDPTNDWWLRAKVPSVCDLQYEELSQIARDAYLLYPLRMRYLRQHVLSRKLPPEYRKVAATIFKVHLRKYVLGMSERSWLMRNLIRGAKKILKPGGRQQ